MTLPIVTVLSHDLRGNALSRASAVAKMLQSDFRVQIVGYGKPDSIWEPLRNDTSFEIRTFYYETVPLLWRKFRSISRNLIDGSAIIAIKPMHASYGLGLAARRYLRRPL